MQQAYKASIETTPKEESAQVSEGNEKGRGSSMTVLEGII